MNKNAFWLFALVCAFLFSCSNNDFEAGNQKNGMVDFTISTSIPQGIKTYASHEGGATNVKGSENDLRYILEVWTKDSPPKLAYRGYKIVGENFATTSVTFSARLLAMEYDFVFWADFVDNVTTEDSAEDADLYYNTHNELGLQAISFKPSSGDYKLSTDARDAFYAKREVDLKTENVIEGVTLTRPFGKYRLVSIDVLEGELEATTVQSAKIEYIGTSVIYGGTTSLKLPGGFNALTGTVNTDNGIAISVANPYLSKSIILEEELSVGGKVYPKAYVLAFDYVFAAPEHTVSFNVTSYSDDKGVNQIGNKKELPNIPIVANKLTTVIGNFFTNEFKYTVSVDDEFGSEDVFTNNTEISASISGNYEISIPPNPSFTPLTYTLSGDISYEAKIIVKNEDPSKPYTGSVTVNIKKTSIATTATVAFDMPGATALVLGNIGTLEITAAAVVNVDMKLSNIIGTKIENAIGKAKVFWATYNGIQLREALGYAAGINNGVNLMANCSYDAGGVPGGQGSLGQQSAFIIGSSDAEGPKTYKEYVFNGNGHTISGTATNQVLQCYSNDATIKNVTVNVKKANMNGITIYNSTGVKLDNVSAINAGRAGFVINASQVTATGLITFGNSWGGVNVDKSGGSVIPNFSWTNSDFAETNPVWSDNELSGGSLLHGMWVKAPSDWTDILVPTEKQILYRPK
ncbi:hypothetical protein EZS27_030877, partial [termite gut metagenome]